MDVKFDHVNIRNYGMLYRFYFISEVVEGFSGGSFYVMTLHKEEGSFFKSFFKK